MTKSHLFSLQRSHILLYRNIRRKTIYCRAASYPPYREDHNTNNILETIQNLRSTHTFSNKDIPSIDIESIISNSVRAATASARQSYSIIVVDDRKALDEFFYGANRALVYCVDYNRLVDTAKHLGHSYEPRDFHHFVAGATDTALAVQTAVIAARSLGIDSLITNVVCRKLAQVSELLKLPEKYCFPLVAVCLGYSAEKPSFRKGRLRDLGIVHYGKYRRLSSEELCELVALYNDEERHLGIIPKEKWVNMGFSHYLDWFFTKWSKRSQDTESLHEVVKRIGFIE